jgi:uncharacterized protein
MDTLCRLMSPDLPHTIEPKRLAKQGETLAGEYAIHGMQRLGELLHDKSGKITFRLKFTRDNDARMSFIMGHIQANLNTVCQRCLGRMALNIERTVYLGILERQDESLQLPDDCEPLILDEQSVSLNDLIEDEVLLAVPISPMHETDKCKGTELLNRINSKYTNNPFSKLQTLVNKPGNQQEN